MGIINDYPYTDFHELNLDYVLNVIKTLESMVENFVSLNAIKYANPIQWSITSQYEKNTVVIDPLTGTAYISVQAVPMGVSLAREEYWTVVFDLASFVTKASKNFANTYEEETTTTATKNTQQYGWLVWGDTLYRANVAITAGDAYVIGSNITRITVEEVVGKIQTLNTSDKTTLVAAINEVLQTITTVSGNLASLTTEEKSNLVAAINEVMTIVTTDVADLQGQIGDLQELDTAVNSDLVSAINEVVDAVNNTMSILSDEIGSLTNLDTDVKTDLVSAINEVVENVGDLARLVTTDDSSLVDAINEVVTSLNASVTVLNGKIGDLTGLSTTVKTDLVSAVNEVVTSVSSLNTTLSGKIGDLAGLDTTVKTDLVSAINEVNSKSSSDYVSVIAHGATGDGSTNDYSAIMSAIDECEATGKTLYFPGANAYKVGTNIVIQDPNFDVIMDSPILYDGINNALTIEDAYMRNFKLSAISNNVTPNNNIGILIKNCSTCRFEIGSVTNFGTSLELLGDDASCSYNNISIIQLNNGYYGLSLKADGTGYVNENLFTKGRIHCDSSKSYFGTTTAIVLVASGSTHPINFNVFQHICIEGSGTGLSLDKAVNNHFDYIRNESVSVDATCTSSCWDNTFTFYSMSNYEDTVQSVNAENNVISLYTSNEVVMYDSGLVAKNSFSNDAHTCLAPDIYTLENNALTRFRKNSERAVNGITCTNHACYGVVVDTKHTKKFIISAEGVEDVQYFGCILCFDNNDQALDSTHVVQGGRWVHFGTNYAWLTSNTRGYTQLVVPDDCDHAFIGIEVPADNLFRGFRILINNNPDTLKYGIPAVIKCHGLALESVPTCDAFPGEFCYDSTGTNLGWIYHSGSWHDVPMPT